MSSQVSFTLAKRGAQWRVRVFTPPGGGDAAGSSGADNGGAGSDSSSASAAAQQPPPHNVTDEEFDAPSEKVDKVVLEIEEHLLKLYRQERSPVVRNPPKAQAQQGQPPPPPPTAFRLQMLRDYFCIDGLSMALPYSADNQRFLQLLEQGRMPRDQLRAFPELLGLCEGKYVNGTLRVEVEDRRLPEHQVESAVGSGVRALTIHMVDDALLQDLSEAEVAHMLESGVAWSREFKLRLESLLLGALSPSPCLHPSLAVGRVCNMLQYNKLKLNARKLRTLPAHHVPLPLKRPRFGAASYGTWVQSQYHAGGLHPPTPGQLLAANAAGTQASAPAVGGKRQRKPTVPGAMPSGAQVLKREMSGADGLGSLGLGSLQGGQPADGGGPAGGGGFCGGA